MAFEDIRKKIQYAENTSERYKRLDALDRLRMGTFYDHIKIPFNLEQDGSTYVFLHERRPSVIWGGAKMLADQLSGLLWGDEQMPIVRVGSGIEDGDDSSAGSGDDAIDQDGNPKPNPKVEANAKAERVIQYVSEKLCLSSVMDEATSKASSGSAVIFLRSMPDKSLYVEVVSGKECTPVLHPRNANVFIAIEQLYPTKGSALRELGYDIPEDKLSANYWFRLLVDKQDEKRYVPMTAERFAMLGQRDPETGEIVRWEIDSARSGPHGWPMLPALWCKAPLGDRLDGECLYGSIKDILVEIDYELSQLARGYKYSADPMLAIRRGELRKGATPAGYDEPSTLKGEDGQVVRDVGNTIDVEPGGEAKLLEISGQGLDKMREFISTLREWGLEIAGGMKSDSETTKGVQSGRALEMLYQNLILVVKRWRVALGDKVYLPLMKMVLQAIDAGLIEIQDVDDVDPDISMRLVWPTWMTPTGPDLLATAQAWEVLAGGSPTAPVTILPKEEITKLAGGNLGFTDTASLVKKVAVKDAQQKKAEADQADADHQRNLETIKAKPAAGPPGSK